MKDNEKEVVDRFLRLFDGNQSHFIQTTETGGTDKKGKAEAEVVTVHENVDVDDVFKHLKGLQPSIGIAPNRDDDTCKFGVLDFDVYGMEDKDVLEVAKYMRVPCFACRSKSHGLHVYFFVDEPVSSRTMHEFLKSRRRNLPKRLRKGVEFFPMDSQLVIPKGDNAKCVNMPMHNAKRQPVWYITADAGYVALDTALTGDVLEAVESGCIIDSGVLEEIAAAAPDIDESDLGYRVPKVSLGRNDCLMKISRSMQARGWPDDALKKEIERLNSEQKIPGYEGEERLTKGEIDAMLKQTLKLEKGSRAPLHYRIVEKFNREWAMMIVEGKVEFLNLEDGQCFPKNAFFDVTAPLTVPTKNGAAPMAKFWMQDVDRNEYRGLVIESPDYEGPGYNIFNGWAVTPKQGDASLWVDYVENILCGGDKELAHWVMTYIADAIQRPWSLHPGSALALRGEAGGGKSFLGRAMGKLLGERQIEEISDSERFFDRFNRRLFGSAFVLAEESMFAGSRKQASTMKSFITSDRWTYEEKYLASFTGKNVHRIIATTNQQQAVHIDNNDRRWTIIEVASPFASDPHGLEAEAFWEPYYDLVDNNGGVILQYLLDYEVDRSLIRYGWITEAKKQDKVLSDPLLAVMDEIARTGIIPDDLRGRGTVSTASLHREVQKHGGRENPRTYANEARKKFRCETAQYATFVERWQSYTTQDGFMTMQPVKNDFRTGLSFPKIADFQHTVAQVTGETYPEFEDWQAYSYGGHTEGSAEAFLEHKAREEAF